MKKIVKFNILSLIISFSSIEGMRLENMFNLALNSSSKTWCKVPDTYWERIKKSKAGTNNEPSTPKDSNSKQPDTAKSTEKPDDEAKNAQANEHTSNENSSKNEASNPTGAENKMRSQVDVKNLERLQEIGKLDQQNVIAHSQEILQIIENVLKTYQKFYDDTEASPSKDNKITDFRDYYEKVMQQKQDVKNYTNNIKDLQKNIKKNEALIKHIENENKIRKFLIRKQMISAKNLNEKDIERQRIEQDWKINTIIGLGDNDFTTQFMGIIKELRKVKLSNPTKQSQLYNIIINAELIATHCIVGSGLISSYILTDMIKDLNELVAGLPYSQISEVISDFSDKSEYEKLNHILTTLECCNLFNPPSCPLTWAINELKYLLNVMSAKDGISSVGISAPSLNRCDKDTFEQRLNVFTEVLNSQINASTEGANDNQKEKKDSDESDSTTTEEGAESTNNIREDSHFDEETIDLLKNYQALLGIIINKIKDDYELTNKKETQEKTINNLKKEHDNSISVIRKQAWIARNEDCLQLKRYQGIEKEELNIIANTLDFWPADNVNYPDEEAPNETDENIKQRILDFLSYKNENNGQNQQSSSEEPDTFTHSENILALIDNNIKLFESIRETIDKLEKARQKLNDSLNLNGKRKFFALEKEETNEETEEEKGKGNEKDKKGLNLDDIKNILKKYKESIAQGKNQIDKLKNFSSKLQAKKLKASNPQEKVVINHLAKDHEHMLASSDVSPHEQSYNDYQKIIGINQVEMQLQKLVKSFNEENKDSHKQEIRTIIQNNSEPDLKNTCNLINEVLNGDHTRSFEANISNCSSLIRETKTNLNTIQEPKIAIEAIEAYLKEVKKAIDQLKLLIKDKEKDETINPHLLALLSDSPSKMEKIQNDTVLTFNNLKKDIEIQERVKTATADEIRSMTRDELNYALNSGIVSDVLSNGKLTKFIEISDAKEFINGIYDLMSSKNSPYAYLISDPNIERIFLAATDGKYIEEVETQFFITKQSVTDKKLKNGRKVKRKYFDDNVAVKVFVSTNKDETATLNRNSDDWGYLLLNHGHFYGDEKKSRKYFRVLIPYTGDDADTDDDGCPIGDTYDLSEKYFFKNDKVYKSFKESDKEFQFPNHWEDEPDTYANIERAKVDKFKEFQSSKDLLEHVQQYLVDKNGHPVLNDPSAVVYFAGPLKTLIENTKKNCTVEKENQEELSKLNARLEKFKNMETNGTNPQERSNATRKIQETQSKINAIKNSKGKSKSLTEFEKIEALTDRIVALAEEDAKKSEQEKGSSKKKTSKKSKSSKTSGKSNTSNKNKNTSSKTKVDADDDDSETNKTSTESKSSKTSDKSNTSNKNKNTSSKTKVDADDDDSETNKTSTESKSSKTSGKPNASSKNKNTSSKSKVDDDLNSSDEYSEDSDAKTSAKSKSSKTSGKPNASGKTKVDADDDEDDSETNKTSAKSKSSKTSGKPNASGKNKNTSSKTKVDADDDEDDSETNKTSTESKSSKTSGKRSYKRGKGRRRGGRK